MPHLPAAQRVLLLFGFLAAVAAAQGAPRPMTIVDLIDLSQLSEPRLSPDGSQLLYVRTDADWKKNDTVSHIWRIDWNGDNEVQMTNGEKGERSPRWSPDGKAIAFIAQRGDDQHAQIYWMSNSGGEAHRLTEHPTDVSNLEWAPDGAWIYFVAAEDKTAEEKEREKAKDNVYRFEEDQKNRHLWRVSVSSRAGQRITEGSFTVVDYDVSRDGQWIAHTRAPTPLLDDMRRAEIFMMRASGEEARQVTDNDVAEIGPMLSPDNERILFVADSDDHLQGSYYNPRPFVMPADGGAARCVVRGGAFAVSSAEWSADGKWIYFRASRGVISQMHRVAAEGGLPERLTKGDHDIRAWHLSPDGKRLAFQATDPRDPGEIRLLKKLSELKPDSGPDDLWQVTSVYGDLAQRFRLPRVETVQWYGEDGVQVEGLLWYPLDYREGTRCPLVVQSHGGPASADRFAFGSSHDYEPVLCALGYFVFKPNYRGSTGYGDDFLRDMVGHYFHQSHKDVMRGVDELIHRGLVDGDRMAKMGWSAGGHMTNKIITYTDRFKAAASGAGAVNWISMYGQSDVRTYRTPWFGGTPWEEGAPVKQYLDDSPLLDLHKVKTPTIVLVGEEDARVPMSQSVELYRALKHLGVPTHLYVAPEQGHGWRQLQQRLFKANAELAWFEKWVRDREYVWERAPTQREPPPIETAADSSSRAPSR